MQILCKQCERTSVVHPCVRWSSHRQGTNCILTVEVCARAPQEKKQREREQQEAEEEEADPDMMAMMGFGGFGGGKK